jgi:tripartite-type tricarboxylate transporter receptor subunit TctC
MFAPAKTPGSTVARLASWFTAALQAPEIREKLLVQGFYPAALCGADFRAMLRKQYDDYERIIRVANIKGR